MKRAKRASVVNVLALFLLVSAIGCGPRFRLAGSFRHPEPITMHVGERRLAISKGINIQNPQWSERLIRSDNTDVVRFDYPDQFTAYIEAVGPGTATVTLNAIKYKDAIRNPTFQVRVVETK